MLVRAGLVLVLVASASPGFADPKKKKAADRGQKLIEPRFQQEEEEDDPKAEPRIDIRPMPHATVDPDGKVTPAPLTDPFDGKASNPVRKPFSTKYVDPFETMTPEFSKPKAVPTVEPRKVWVQLQDGSKVNGIVVAERPDILMIDASLGQISIPRGRIRLVAYDKAP